MPIYQYDVIFFRSGNTIPQVQSGAHIHSALLIHGIPAGGRTFYSWGAVDTSISMMSITGRRSALPTQLPPGVYYSQNLGVYGHVAHTAQTINTPAATIIQRMNQWTPNQNSTQYPNNCRGAVDHFIANFGGNNFLQIINQLMAAYTACR
ncbi:hypothetical protein JFU49_03305 [Pseudomonas sp. TH03]|uniref:hypothetical protein n=1 Tax=Pseudomonas sp. TH03 TaxID=2796369 RepID=UPI001911DB51|nr:hypothetical protein [Pseudomonas sp. TH03]MBK5549314.1 hypothetical protein [Pseudomonas sp. TH03]